MEEFHKELFDLIENHDNGVINDENYLKMFLEAMHNHKEKLSNERIGFLIDVILNEPIFE